MGVPEAAECLGVTQRTLYKFVDEGALPAYKLGRVIRLKREDVTPSSSPSGSPRGH